MKRKAKDGGKQKRNAGINAPARRSAKSGAPPNSKDGGRPNLPAGADWEMWRRLDVWPLRLAVWLSTGRLMNDSNGPNDPE